MAAPQPVSENPEVAHHYATQVALAAALAEALRRSTPDDLHTAAAFKHFVLIAAAITQRFSVGSISLSIDHYEAMREQADVPGAFRVPMSDPWETSQIEAYLESATEKIRADIDVEANALMQQAESAAQKIALDAGRNQVIGASRADPRGGGWARVTRPGACSFCRLLATRGHVYSENTVEFQAHSRFDGRGGDCQCGAEPIFGTFKLAPHIQADLALYHEVGSGLPPKEARKAFRRAVEAQQSA